MPCEAEQGVLFQRCHREGRHVLPGALPAYSGTERLTSFVSAIAASVEEQSVATKEIANNMGQASQGIQEMNENVAQSSVVSGEIVKAISNVNQESKEISNGSSQAKVSASALSTFHALDT